MLQVIFCAAARTTLRADLLRVEDRGVATLAQAFQVSHPSRTEPLHNPSTLACALPPRDQQNPPLYIHSLTRSAPAQDEMDRRSKKKKLKSSTRSKREIADFRRTYHQERWDITYCGLPVGDRSAEPAINTSAAVINDNNNLEFAGAAPIAAWPVRAS